MPRSHGVSRGGQVAAHQVFGFVPYWLMGQVSHADLSTLSTVAYFAVGVNGNGTFDRSGPGWADYRSSRLTALVKQAHASGDRVVLTVSAFDQTTLDQLTHSAQAPYRLARAITDALIAKSLDGVNIDFEGVGSGDRAGLVTLVTELSRQLRAVDPEWQITMDTFGSSASDASGFVDIKDLAPAVDAFFVMAYDMGRPHAVSPTAPLTGPDPNDTEVVGSYLSAVPASKILLGIPLYAYAYPTAGPLPGAPVTGAPVTLTEDQIATEARQVYWDSATQVAWTAWRGGRQWYQTYFDDPDSVAAKVRLAGQSGLAGVGVWSVGMGNSEAIRNALTLGGAAKDWRPSPEPPISAAYSVLASLSPFPSDLTGLAFSGFSSDFSDLSGLSSDVGYAGGVGGGGTSSNLPAGGQSPPRPGSPGTTATAPGTSGQGHSSPGAPSARATTPTTSAPATTTPRRSGHEDFGLQPASARPTTPTTSAPATTTPTASAPATTTPTTSAPATTTPTTSAPATTTPTTATGGSGGPPAGVPSPPAHLCQVVGALEQLAEALPEPGAPGDQASAVASAIGATAPGCAQSPPAFAGPSPPLCDLLAGVAQVATPGPNERLAADALYQSARCWTTVPAAPAPGEVAPSVQAMACAVGVAAGHQGSAAFEQWATWLSATAGCSPFHLLGSVPAALSPLVKEVPQLAAALGDSTGEVCSVARMAGVTDPQCGWSPPTTSTTAGASRTTSPPSTSSSSP